jgi:hypothetical protein
LDRFEYVMVLISIIVGLGIAHVLLGVGGLIDRRSGSKPDIKLSLTHGAWLAFTFAWLVQFWWWEFRFSELDPVWTLDLYLFLVTYAVGLFLMAVILVPRTWDGVEDLDDYFLSRRAWFFSILIGMTGFDLIDSYLKGGWSYVADTLGPYTWGFWVACVVAALIGIRSKNLRYHKIAGVTLFLWQQAQAFAEFSLLGF